ncbi:MULTISPECIES: large-conductance mechanosensitive channel protein MscL [unclassified Salegentibacter]|jgi:large conductance mechanosensitive channel|uniref:large-conductance mechanosensitive channel protein MscL n=1 Tax=unclassified Salegentibacter TaxID=2633436 RepID=UPI00094A393E|nr:MULTISPECIES: large-conductance mechanosensitive channel protein MscL [unclassified Salegentibacter]APS39741.1 mechanosensitive ion channel protein MscL [Salegentibacter sp. T436]|tara:strand:- start:6742 stop:7197 length:456 start_codon:yes stop_codon:yes gene_type:complete
MGILKEFKEFAIKGNMVDMAVGIIIGTAFNSVVNTLVKEVVMPPLSLMTDGIEFANRKWVLREGVAEAEGTQLVEEVAIGYGALIEAFLDFLIIGFTIFLVIKFMNRFRKKAQDPEDKREVTPKDIELLSKMNQLMEEQNQLLKNNYPNKK